MKTLLTVSLVLVSAMLISVPASATVVWDGSGSPADHGFTAMGDVADAMHFDTVVAGVPPDQTFTSAPGTMAQSAPGGAPGDPAAYYTFDGTGLVGATGWSLETRVQTISNATGYNVAIGATGDTGGFIVEAWAEQVDVWSGDWTNETLITGLGSGYHTVRGVVAPAATVAQIYVDDALKTSIALEGSTPGGAFGDFSGVGRGVANWDYVNVTQTPEPGTLALLAMALIGLLCYAWRKRK